MYDKYHLISILFTTKEGQEEITFEECRVEYVMIFFSFIKLLVWGLIFHASSYFLCKSLFTCV